MSSSSKSEIALQLTLHAMEKDLLRAIDATRSAKVNQTHAKEIVDFYNYIYDNLEKEPTFSFE